MVKIEHINGDVKNVTRGAFESVFKPLGYKLVAKEEKMVAPVKVEEKDINLGNEDKEEVKEIGKENSKEVSKRK